MFCWLASTPTIIQLGCQARFNISTDSSLWRDPAGNAIAFNNCSHLQQHHPATAVFPAIQTPFKINLSSKNIISCKMNHRALFLAPLFLFLAPVAPPPSNNLFKLPNSEQWSNLLPLRGPVNSDFIRGKRKKEVYIPGCLLTNKGLIWNGPSVACEWASFEYSMQNIIWLQGVSRYFHEHEAPIGQHMSPPTLKPRSTPFGAGAAPRHPTSRTARFIPPLRSSRRITSVFISTQSLAHFLH